MHFFRKIKEQRQMSKDKRTKSQEPRTKNQDKRNLPPNPLKGEFTRSMEDFIIEKPMNYLTDEQINQSTDEPINK
jgi:hypothetical protein